MWMEGSKQMTSEECAAGDSARGRESQRPSVMQFSSPLLPPTYFDNVSITIKFTYLQVE